jgi:23S rRNA pseudouridine1911/1915/1917 synthase
MRANGGNSVKTVISTSGTLLELLRQLIPGASNRTLRQMLEQERVRVNGKAVKMAGHPIDAGSAIEIGPRKEEPKLPAGLEILFEDRAILILYKPSGLLTVSTPGEKGNNAFALLKKHLKERDGSQNLQIVHRLDRFASGLLVFAKSEEVRACLKDLFRDHDIRRRYWAIVEGNVRRDSGTIRSYLAERKDFRVYSVQEGESGQLAVTHYRVLNRVPGFSLLEVTLETGRKNQIRVHLSEMGHPVVGDRAYGSGKNPIGRLGLHAFHLGFTHPTGNKPVEFKTEPPPEFLPYMKRPNVERLKSV